MTPIAKIFLKKISFISSLRRSWKQLIMIISDTVLALLIIFSAFSLRLGYWYIPGGVEIYVFENWIIYFAPLILIPVFYIFGLYKSVTQFIGLRGISRLAQAIALYCSIWGLLIYMLNIEGIPRSVILINWTLSTIVFIGSRVFARWLLYAHQSTNLAKNKVLIYGANQSGIELSESLHMSSLYENVAFIDDDVSLEGSYLNGISVFGSNKIKQLVESFKVKDIFLALPNLSRNERRLIIENLSKLQVRVKSLPSINLLAQGKIKVDDLREINIHDLLGRKPVEADESLLKKNITKKVVLVSGAGGSIGSELCIQILNLEPEKLLLFEISESALYEIEQKLLTLNADNIEVIPILGSIRDENRLKNILNTYSVQTIYHAAAYKHVPLVEYNESEGVLNNAIGTMVFARAAMSANVEIFVLISTDKAVRPTNVMGATKRIAELSLQALSKIESKTCFTMVRFGNVLDSSGSVIPLFRKQIKDGGPITVTDKNIVRFFMTIPEAVELVIQSGSMANGGEVFVLDMGEPIKINDLAIKMIQLSGLQLNDHENPNGDIEIKYTGLRPGEKLFEELLIGENTLKTKNKLIFKAEEEMINWNVLEPLLLELKDASVKADREKTRQMLVKIVPEFRL